MAKKSTVDAESVLKLVINNEQAKTSMRELSDAIRKYDRELANLKKSDDPKGYAERAESVRKLKAALEAAKVETRGLKQEAKEVTEEMNGFRATWKEITTGLVGKFALGDLIATGIENAIGAITNFIAGSQMAYKEAAQNSAQLDAVLRSTSGVAGKTRDELDKMAESIMNVTGVDDDLITQSEALLLTFTNIREEIFDQTIPVIVDLSKALNQDLQTSTIQVGKALNDPIKGITALRKVGVSFSDDQVKMIKSMVQTNNVAGAQSLILAELNKEFGGVAAAKAGALGMAEKYQSILGNLQEKIGGFLTKAQIPFLERLADTAQVIENWLIPAQKSEGEILEETKNAFNAQIAVLKNGNFTQEQRGKLINEINKEYKEYLPQLISEKASLEQISLIQDQVNKKLTAKILLIGYEKELATIIALQAASAGMLYENERKRQGINLGTDKRFKDAPASVTNSILSNLDIADKASKKIISETDKTQAVVKQKWDSIAKSMGTTLEEIYRVAGGGSGNMEPFSLSGGGGSKDKEASYLESLLDKMNDAYSDALSDRLDGIEKEEQAVRNKYAKEEREAEKSIQNELALAEAKQAINKAMEAELQTLRVKRSKEESALIDKLIAEAQADFDKFLEEKAKAQEQIFQAGMSQEQQEILAADQKYELLIAMAEKYGEDTTELYKKWEKEKNLIYKKSKDEELKTTEETEGEKRELIERMAREAANTVFTIMANSRNAETEARISQIEAERDRELEGRELTREQEEAINKKFDDKVRAERKRAWLAEQKAAIAQALINAAIGITAAWKNPYAAPFTIPLIMATTAAQIAVIAAQKAPQFAKGGIIPNGPSHASGGIKLVDSISGSIVGEMEGGEPIISKNTYANNKELVDTLLYSGQRRNGASIGINTQGAVEAERLFRLGGVSPTSGGPTSHSSVHNNILRTDTSALEKKMDRFIEVAENAWNLRVLEEAMRKRDAIRDSVNG